MTTISTCQDSNPFTTKDLLGFGEISHRHTPKNPKSKIIHIIAITILTSVAITAATAIITTGIGAAIAATAGASMALSLKISSVAGGSIGIATAAFLASFIATRRRRDAIPTNHETIKREGPLRLGEINKAEAIISPNAKESAEWKFSLIRSAKKSIELSGNFCGGVIFREALEVIRETMQANTELKTHIIASDECLLKEDRKLLNELSACYPDRFFFLETKQNILTHPFVGTSENHVKALIIDEEFSMIGGTGIQDVLCGHTGDIKPIRKSNETWKDRIIAPTRDMDIITRGASSKILRHEFYKLWNLWAQQMKQSKLLHCSYFPVDRQNAGVSDKWKGNEGKVRIANITQLVSDPIHHTNQITDGLIKLLKSAEKSILIANLAFNPSEKVLDAMIDAANRGVTIKVLTNATDKESPFTNRLWAKSAHQSYLPLMAGKRIHKLNKKGLSESAMKLSVKIYEYAVPDILFHEKVAIIDDRYTMIGSYNLTKKSHHLDHELVQIVDSVDIARDASTLIEEDMLKRSNAVSFDKAFKWYKSPIGWIQKEYVANFFA